MGFQSGKYGQEDILILCSFSQIKGPRLGSESCAVGLDRSILYTAVVPYSIGNEVFVHMLPQIP